MAPGLDFVGGQRAPFTIDHNELIIGRGGDCGLRVDSDLAAERHARLTIDGGGSAFIQDLDTQTGTLRNGNYVYGVQQLDDGDRIEIGGVALMFRAVSSAPVAAPAPVAAAAAPVARRAGADDRTRMPMELPPEVKALLAQRESQTAVPTGTKPPPPVQAAPAGVIVGKPEPEPDNFRTVQMEAPDLAALGIDPASLPPAPVKPQAQPLQAKRTMMGMGVVAPSLGYAPTAELPAANAQKPKATPQQATMMAPAPAITQQPIAQQPYSPQPSVQQPHSGHAGYAQEPMAPQDIVSSTAPYSAQPTSQPMAPPKTAPLMMAVVPEAVPYEETAKTNPLPHNAAAKPNQEYTPPKKGAFGSFSRALEFMGQIFTLARQHKALFKPLIWDVALTTPLMAIFAVLDYLFVHSSGAFYASMAVEGFLLYFVDYACNSITASLMYDYATTGEASMATAGPRVRHALPGIMTFAAVSALLDVASTYARERHDIVAKIVLRILRAVWTTATYVIMPALVIEGISFGDAFKRSKQLMDHDPTGVGAGVVAMSLTSYIVAIICFPLAWFMMRILGHVTPALGAFAGMLIINLYWAVSGWLKISYATCFYMWARECERVGGADHALAPTPLRAALDAA